MNLNKAKNWETIDIAPGGYVETSYEYFDYICDVPLLKAKGKDIWYIGTIKNGNKIKQTNLFNDELKARCAFESVKRFQKSELESRNRFEGKTIEFLEKWLDEFGSNPYVGNSIYNVEATNALQLAKKLKAEAQGENAMDNKIIAIIKYPFQEPQTVYIGADYKELQKIVGGTITGADLPDMEDIFGYANDESILMGLEPNIYRPEYKDAIFGPIVLVGARDDGGKMSLTNEQIKTVTNYLTKNAVKNFTELLYNVETNFENYKPKNFMCM